MAWGDPNMGGSIPEAVAANLSGNVTYIFSTERAFAALKTGGEVVAWGWSSFGGSIPVAAASKLSSGVISVVGISRAFAAIRAGGDSA